MSHIEHFAIVNR